MMQLLSRWRLHLPEIAPTVRRFPLPTALLAALTLLYFADTYHWFVVADRWPLALAALLPFGVAGRLIAESRACKHPVTAALLYGLPLLVALCSYSDDSTAPELLARWGVAGVLLLAVAPFTRWGEPAAQDQFWWFNHRLFVSATFTLIGTGLFCLGLQGVTWSLDALFGIDISEFTWTIVTAVAFIFVAPLYFLSTIPQQGDYATDILTTPDFQSRIIGALGQYILVPFALIIALILSAYTLQITLTRTLPNGELSWMVPWFLFSGAVTWLVVHPPFLRKRLLVRLFRRSWFWFTLLPLAALAVSLSVRIDAYGLTGPRLLLVGSGVWAALITALFLTRRFADIRLMPALAVLILVAMSFGPAPIESWARHDQTGRLDAALAAALQPNADGATRFAWTEATSAQARSAIAYLDEDDPGRAALRRLADKYAVALPDPLPSFDGFIAAVALPDTPDARSWDSPERDQTLPVDLGNATVLLGTVSTYRHSPASIAGLEISITADGLEIRSAGAEQTPVPLRDMLAQTPPLSDPRLTFVHAGRRYLLVINRYGRQAEPTDPQRFILQSLDGLLFGEAGLQ
jgi:hypothetical protein